MCIRHADFECLCQCAQKMTGTSIIASYHGLAISAVTIRCKNQAALTTINALKAIAWSSSKNGKFKKSTKKLTSVNAKLT